MCNHIVKLLKEEQEREQLAEENRDQNRNQLIETLHRRHEAINELERKAGVKKLRSIAQTAELQMNTRGLRMTENMTQRSELGDTNRSNRGMGESQVIKKLKMPKPVL